MGIEIAAIVVLLTVLRLAWIMKQPVHKDISFYILPGLSNLRKILRYDPDFSYVPYGLLWYAINVPIVRAARYSGRAWMAVLAVLDSFFLWYSSILGLALFVAYAMIGTFQLLRAPWNVSINWFVVLAPISWIFLVLAPIAKFPVGLPLQVWGYTERAVGHQHNYIYFGLLGTLWLLVFNHLYFFPTIDTVAVAVFGIVWTIILGHAYMTRGSRRNKQAPDSIS